jgi:hypothetical protein
LKLASAGFENHHSFKERIIFFYSWEGSQARKRRKGLGEAEVKGGRGI